MNLDFHYYATHLAARLAGYDYNDALTLARAAQFVDDLTLDNYVHDAKKPARDQIITCMSMPELAGYFTQVSLWTPDQVRKFHRIWTAFHFAPGDTSPIYEGETHRKDMNWTMGDEDRKAIQRICQPGNGFLCRMVNEVQKMSRSPFSIHLAGLVMHVFADSWAHQNFAGVPSMCVNDIEAGTGVHIKTHDGQWRKALLTVVKDDLSKYAFATTPPAIFPQEKLWTGISYLAHARVGSIADYACLTFRYSPYYKTRSSKPTVERDNTALFYQAFIQMTAALRCIREGKPFVINEKTDETDVEVFNVLKTPKLDQSAEWNSLIVKRFGKSLPSYRYNQWIEEYKAGYADYTLFTSAAECFLKYFDEAYPL